MGVGNFPALERPGPSRRGICLINVSEDKKASYFLASFFTSFLFLFSLRHDINANERRGETLFTNFFKSSTDMYSRSICLARSMSAASARMQIDNLGRGTFGSLSTRVRLSTVSVANPQLT